MRIRLSRTSISVGAATQELLGPGLGGIVVFAGRVRPDRLGGGTVRALDYEVDREPALARLREIERRANRRFGTRRVVLWHRVGRVRAGEIAVVVGAACDHRDAAFAAARFLIDELKRSVPIWKTVQGPPGRRPRRRRSPRAGRGAG